jgi:hypothetical protein
VLNPELLAALSGAPQAEDSFLIQDGAETVPRRVPAASILNPNLLASETGGLTSTEHLLVQVNGESVPRVMNASLLPTGASTKQELPCYIDDVQSNGGSFIGSSWGSELSKTFSVPRTGIYLFGGSASAYGAILPSETGQHYIYIRFACPDGSYSPTYRIFAMFQAGHDHIVPSHNHSQPTHRHWTTTTAPNGFWSDYAGGENTGTKGSVYTQDGGKTEAQAGGVSFTIPLSLTAGTRYAQVEMEYDGGSWTLGPYASGMNLWLAEIG